MKGRANEAEMEEIGMMRHWLTHDESGNVMAEVEAIGRLLAFMAGKMAWNISVLEVWSSRRCWNWCVGSRAGCCIPEFSISLTTFEHRILFCSHPRGSASVISPYIPASSTDISPLGNEPGYSPAARYFHDIMERQSYDLSIHWCCVGH